MQKLGILQFPSPSELGSQVKNWLWQIWKLEKNVIHILAWAFFTRITHDNCKSYSYNAPSQSKEPLISSPQTDGHSNRFVEVIFIIKDTHTYQFLINFVAGYVYITLNQDQPPVKISSPIAEPSLWTMEPLKNLALMGAHSLYQHCSKTFLRHGESNIDSHKWATHNPVVELRLQLKLLNI